MGAPVTVFERVPVDRINAEARQVHLGRLLLTVLAAFFFALGWVVAKTFLALAWCGVAVKVGWQEARSGAARPSG
jgi:hypothetical protein